MVRYMGNAVISRTRANSSFMKPLVCTVYMKVQNVLQIVAFWNDVHLLFNRAHELWGGSFVNTG